MGRHEKILSRKWPGEIGALEESPAVWVMDGAGGCARNRTKRRGRSLRDLPEVTKALMAARELGLGSVRPLSVVWVALSVDEASREGGGVALCLWEA